MKKVISADQVKIGDLLLAANPENIVKDCLRVVSKIIEIKNNNLLFLTRNNLPIMTAGKFDTIQIVRIEF